MSDFRLATAQDVEALAALYRTAALTLGPQRYSAAQVAAWARSPDDTAAFARYILDAQTWVDDGGPHGGAPRGFCGISVHDDVGEVHSLYVAPAFGRQGIGSRLLAHALAHARAGQDARRFEAWATPFSRPVFERAGFVLERVVSEAYQGVVFDRSRMVRPGF